MYLSKVRIKNFRNLQDVTVELGEKVVLLGENSVGKSNFLEALRMLLDSNYRVLLDENDFSRGITPFKGTTIEIHAWFAGIDPEKDKDLLVVVHDCHGKEVQSYKLSAVYRPKQDKTPENAINEDDYELIRYGGDNPSNTEGAKRFRQYVRLFVVPAVRDMERDMQSWRTSPLRRLVESIGLTNQPEFTQVAKEVGDASKKLQDILPIRELQKDICALLGNLVEEQSIEPTIGIAASQPEDLQRLLTILVETGLPIDRTSLGLANVLYLITWLLYFERLRNIPFKNDQKPQYVMFAIEEPEAHLHPHFQRLVFENMFQREHLLLVSTHSSTIVSVADPRHFVVLKRTGQGITARSTAHFAPEDEKMRQDISRFLDATRGEVVFARGVLLVEGDAEMFLLPAFAQKMKEAGKIPHTLDGAGISVCNVYGADFHPYVEFLGSSGLDIPFAILTDGDPTTENNKEDIQQGFAGLERGLKLARRLKAPNFPEIEESYQKRDWDRVRAGLEEVGIFVNGQTLEVELIQIGYGDEFCDVYSELGASELQKERLRAAIQREAFNVNKIISRIETVGMGKGRFAQRLADRLDADRVPPYIEKAIRYLLAKMPQPAPILQLLPAPEETIENIEDDIPF